MEIEDFRLGLQTARERLVSGWRHLMHTATGALTRFAPGARTRLPHLAKVTDDRFVPTVGWSMLGSDVFETEDRVVVRLELPGLQREDVDVEIEDDTLVVSGEKRFFEEQGEGAWRLVQCAYGSFTRVVPLPVPVRSAGAKASYRDGVLRVEMPKATPGRGRRVLVA